LRSPCSPVKDEMSPQFFPGPSIWSGTWMKDVPFSSFKKLIVAFFDSTAWVRPFGIVITIVSLREQDSGVQSLLGFGVDHYREIIIIRIQLRQFGTVRDIFQGA